MQEELKTKLAVLKTSLENIDELDDESRQLLMQVDADIQTVLNGQDTPSLDRQLEKKAVQFEGQHPQISAILRDIIDALGKMGI